MHVKQDRRTLERQLEMRELERAALGGGEHDEGLPARMLLAFSCWLVERAWELRRQGGAFQSESARWGRIEVRPIVSACECER